MQVEAEANSILPMHKLDIVQDGKVVYSVTASDPHQVKLSTTLTVQRSGWVAARVTGPEKQHLLMDSYVYAHTSPVYLTKGGERPRSPEDAHYFIDWIDQVSKQLRESDDFDTPAQKEEVLQTWAKGREVFARLVK